MERLRQVSQVRALVGEWKASNLKVGFVPTMGALHKGHLSLVQEARDSGADRLVVSIFVNPTQFGENEDLDAYPRSVERDVELLAEMGVDLLFAPTVDTIYPEGHESYVVLERSPLMLCGLNRQGHFRGVSTVVTQLFNIVQPDLAVFGEKDFQQLHIIRRMVRDLHQPVDIVGAPIIRGSDGLALSSRNAYLNESERIQARCLSQSLRAAATLLERGERSAEVLLLSMRAHCEGAGGRVDYVAIVDENTLQPVQIVDRPVRALLAIYIGLTRLIDNCRLDPACALSLTPPGIEL